MTWADKSKNRAIEETWLFQIQDASETNTIYLATRDVTIDSNRYYGIVSNVGTLNKSMDLKNSLASLGSTTITCQNNYKGKALSDIIYYDGTYYYLNGRVKIYSTFGNTTIATSTQLGAYRIESMEHDAENVYIELEEYQPWAKLKLPIERSLKGPYFPLVYGDFTAESSTGSSPALCHDAKCWPAPIVVVSQEFTQALVYPGASGTETAHFYEKSIKPGGLSAEPGIYVPLLDNGGTNDMTISNKTSYPGDTQCQTIDIKPGRMMRGFQYFTDTEAGPDNNFTSPAGVRGDATSTSSATYSRTFNGGSGGSGTQYRYLELSMPVVPGYFDDFDIQFKVAAEIYDPNTNNNVTMDIFDVSYNTSSTPDIGDATSIGIAQLSATGGGTGDWSATDDQYSLSASGGYDPTTNSYYDGFASSGAWTTDEFTFKRANFYDANDNYPRTLKLCVKYAIADPGAGESVFIGVWVASYIVKKALVQFADGSEELPREFSLWAQDIDTLYCGFDGPEKSWSSGTALEPQQIHREILQTWCGVATAEIDTTSFGNCDTAKDGHTCRFWETEPRSAKEILDELQLNGGFITFWQNDGTLKYDYIKDSYSAGDVSYTLDEDDYRNFNVMLTALSDIVTKRVYRYDRDAATDELQQSSTETNSTTRTNLGIDAEENIEEIELKYLVAKVNTGSNPNDSLAEYYKHILSEVRKTVECEVVNPKMFDLELGDIVQFSDNDIDPFDETWGSMYFKIIKTRRTMDRLNIKCFEVS